MPPITPPATVKDPSVAALLEAVRRCERGGAPRSVLLLHLAGAEGVQPHHRRVARAILAEVGQFLEGEVLRLSDGDLALICRRRPDRPDPAGPDGAGPEGLPAVLDRLFAAADTQGRALYARWRLPEQADTLRAALLARAAPEAAAEPAAAPDELRILTEADGPIMLRRQTGVRLHLDGGRRRFRPCFQEVTGDHGATPLHSPDPFLARHRAARIDRRIVAILLARLGQGQAPWSALPGPLHVTMTPDAVLSEPSLALHAACRAQGGTLGVRVAMSEACSAPASFAAAQARLEEWGAALVLDGLTPEAFAAARPAHLGASLVVLQWRADLSRLAGLARGRLVEALRAIGPDKVVLTRAETEAALGWGLAHGITRFQGRHVDAMLAAFRLRTCRFAAGCTLRQCLDRAAAGASDGRQGCGDHAVLDASAGRDLVLPE